MHIDYYSFFLFLTTIILYIHTCYTQTIGILHTTIVMIAINRNNFKFVLYTNTLGTHYAMYLQLINEYYILLRILGPIRQNTKLRVSM